MLGLVICQTGYLVTFCLFFQQKKLWLRAFYQDDGNFSGLKSVVFILKISMNVRAVVTFKKKRKKKELCEICRQGFASQKCQNSNKFCLKWKYFCESIKVSRWVNIAVASNVQVLNVLLHCACDSCSDLGYKLCLGASLPVIH